MLVVVIACAACESRYGAYLVVESSDAAHPIQFDELDFYIGLRGGTAVPTSPLHPMLLASTDHQARYKRTQVASDEWLDPNGDGHTTYTYYLPSNTVDATLGPYVLVVASRGGVPVGVGEFETFMVLSTEVDEYPLELAPWDEGAEQWGGPDHTDCVRWQRMRPGDTTPSTFAVVTDNDRDCDGFQDPIDCNELQYCDATHLDGCTGEAGCIVGIPGVANCALASCFNDPADPTATMPTCGGSPQTCLSDAACGSSCATITDLDMRLQCSVMSSSAREVATIPVSIDGTLCTSPETFVATVPTLCPNIRIESPINGLTSDGFQYTVTSSAGDCSLTIAEGPQNAPWGTRYLLFSVDGPDGPMYPRTTIGVEIDGVPGTCNGVTTLIQGTSASCPN